MKPENEDTTETTKQKLILKMTTNDLKLWLIVEENFDKIFDDLRPEFRGLCNVINVLYEKNLVGLIGKKTLKNTINKYAKSRGRQLRTYVWNVGEKKAQKIIHSKTNIKRNSTRYVRKKLYFLKQFLNF